MNDLSKAFYYKLFDLKFWIEWLIYNHPEFTADDFDSEFFDKFSLYDRSDLENGALPEGERLSSIVPRIYKDIDILEDYFVESRREVKDCEKLNN